MVGANLAGVSSGVVAFRRAQCVPCGGFHAEHGLALVQSWQCAHSAIAWFDVGRDDFAQLLGLAIFAIGVNGCDSVFCTHLDRIDFSHLVG